MWNSAPELASSNTLFQHVLWIAIFFLQFNYINLNVSHNVMSDLQLWLSGQSVALNKLEIASSDSGGVLLP
jgi:hypothetical protein